MNTGITGPDDIALVDDIIDSKLMLQKKGPSFFDIPTEGLSKNALKQGPEAVLGMPVKEAIFSGFDRGEGTQDQYFGISLKKWLEWMGNGLMFGHFNLSQAFHQGLSKIVVGETFWNSIIASNI